MEHEPLHTKDRVLICLDSPKVARIVHHHLAARGIASSHISLVDLAEGLFDPSVSLVVTRTALIGRVSAAWRSAIINVEAFIFDVTGETPSGRFDPDAFTKGVASTLETSGVYRRPVREANPRAAASFAWSAWFSMGLQNILPHHRKPTSTD